MHPARLAVFAAVSLGLTMAAPASAAPPAPPAVGQDSVTGTWTQLVDVYQVEQTISARSGPNGENPSGQYTFGLSGDPVFLTEGPVTCLSVHGNVALIKVAATTIVRNRREPSPLALRITDSGPTGRDLVENATPTLPLTQCAQPEPVYTAQPAIAMGDIIVVDADPLPTTKAQCKNDRWKNFGATFKNQGQCVAFVERGLKSRTEGPLHAFATSPWSEPYRLCCYWRS